jgi:hypothetical protein
MTRQLRIVEVAYVDDTALAVLKDGEAHAGRTHAADVAK